MKRRPLSKKKRFLIFERDNFTCQYCGAKAPDADLRVDHIRPVANGGTDDRANLITACFECNAGKGAIVLRRGSPRATLTAAESVEEECYDLDAIVRESTTVYKRVETRSASGEWLPENDFLQRDRKKGEQAGRWLRR